MKKNLVFSIAFIVIAITVLSVKADAAWIKDSKGWWNSEDKGYSVGWKYINNQWYFFNNEGYMVTGWLLSDGKWYYFYDNGAMARNTSIDNYVIGNDGAWIQEEIEKNIDFIDDDSLRETIFNNLPDKDKKIITDYKSSNISKEILQKDRGVINDESYIGKEVYTVDFEDTIYGRPNNMIVYVSIDNLKVIGYGLVD